ncbi:cytochrome [Mycolicibacterium litorale]|nr:cytochrome [Mycolicibacterium litorale]
MLAAADPYPYYRWLRENAPVHRLAESDFYLVSSWELVTDALGRGGDFSSNLTATMILDTDGVRPFGLAGPGDGSHVLATADDPIHDVHRKAVLPALAARRIRALEPFIASTSRTLWADARTAGSVDWVAAVADRLPMIVVARLVGFPAVDVDWLVSGAYATTQMLDGAITADQLARAVSAAGELASYLSAEFASARRNPGDNLLGDLARLCNDGALDADTCMLMLMQLVGAGGESTGGLLGNAAWLLATHQDVAARVRGEPELVRTFIEEALRLESPFRGHYRHVLRDTELGGVPLPAGSHLLLLWGAANRDPAAFDAPDTLRLDRPGIRSHLAFGKGIHFCVGAALARLETRIALTGLLGETTDLQTTEPPAWVPSVTIRRLERLPLRT